MRVVRGERSVVDVLNDILGNLQRIVHSEIRLGRAAPATTSAAPQAMGFITILAVVFTTGALRARHVAMPSSGERTKENRG